MRRVVVMIRHAKSSWANPLQSDFERPLNERGKHDAPMMGERLKSQQLYPDLIISSSAKRARQTAKRIAETLNYAEDRILQYDKLYHCIRSVFEEVLYEIDANIQTVYIVAHNPGITDFVNHLSPQFEIDNMPTCGVVAMEFNSSEWNEFNGATKKVFLFDYPKNES